MDEEDFLRQILAHPDDSTARLVYADWLEERGDPRAPFLRTDPGLARISCVAWLEARGGLDYYVEKIPEVRREAEARRDTATLREHRRGLAASLDPGWVAFFDTLACPSGPFFFFNNGGDPREFHPVEIPFAEPLVTRGAVVTFESDFRDERSWDPGLLRDLGFLARLELEDCAYGAATCPAHPFLCEINNEGRPSLGSDILDALRPKAFRRPPRSTWQAPGSGHPDEQPGHHRGHQADEFHSDFREQFLFAHHLESEDEDEDGEFAGSEVDETAGPHGRLKEYLFGRLWYVLLHTDPDPRMEYTFSRYAVLLAVGLSPEGRRLVGVISHQNCHNLCD